MKKTLLALYGLKWNPFSPEIPIEALYVRPQIVPRQDVRPFFVLLQIGRQLRGAQRRPVLDTDTVLKE